MSQSVWIRGAESAVTQPLSTTPRAHGVSVAVERSRVTTSHFSHISTSYYHRLTRIDFRDTVC